MKTWKDYYNIDKRLCDLSEKVISECETQFKALDEIEIPQAEKVRANRPALTEIFSRKTKFDTLMEEYYDISSNEGLEDAKDAREAEVAQAKLARIEKIVDLDAESAEDLLTSYVGKVIMQCPQCMTLFYKNPEDVVASEEDPATVNVNEVCQHCGNESGYSIIGKVGEAEPEEAAPEELPAEGELDLDVESEEAAEETTEESSEEDLNFDDELEEFDLDNIEDDVEGEEKKEESFVTHTGEALVEELADDKDLDAKLEAHNEYIEYLRNMIAQEEAALENTNTLTITHETIGNHLGSPREVVTRMLRYFQNEEMVKLARGTVELTNLKKLRMLQ